ELRALRAQLQRDDDAVSYVRRLVQARIDLVRAEQRARADGSGEVHVPDLAGILGQHLTGGPARPPRPADDASEHPLAVELDELGARLGANHVSELNDAELETLASALGEFEHE